MPHRQADEAPFPANRHTFEKKGKQLAAMKKLGKC